MGFRMQRMRFKSPSDAWAMEFSISTWNLTASCGESARSFAQDNRKLRKTSDNRAGEKVFRLQRTSIQWASVRTSKERKRASISEYM